MVSKDPNISIINVLFFVFWGNTLHFLRGSKLASLHPRTVNKTHLDMWAALKLLAPQGRTILRTPVYNQYLRGWNCQHRFSLSEWDRCLHVFFCKKTGASWTARKYVTHALRMNKTMSNGDSINPTILIDPYTSLYTIPVASKPSSDWLINPWNFPVNVQSFGYTVNLLLIFDQGTAANVQVPCSLHVDSPMSKPIPSYSYVIIESSWDYYIVDMMMIWYENDYTT